MKYELRTGKFGSSFHDNEESKDLPLDEVLGLLNTPKETDRRWYLKGSLPNALYKAKLAKVIIEAKIFILDTPPGHSFTCDRCPLFGPLSKFPCTEGTPCAVLLNDYINLMEEKFLAP